MIRPLVHDPIFLAIPSEPASKDDLSVSKDLKDTLLFHKDACVGMAANMIGIAKRIIVFDDGLGPIIMFNPEITMKIGKYEAEESCLSLLGGPRKAERYHTIKVSYEDERFKKKTGIFTGFAAQIIQHEIDHINGILI
ncbi:MAG: peptide deformylase [Clostridia bacterium]|nr:peptide deformylase [Clostridia bacterium]